MAQRRGEYRKTAERREQILDAAFEVFSHVGYVGATVSEISRTVGMSQPGLLHHFDSKIALLEGVFERRDRVAVELLRERHGVDFLRGLLEITERNEKHPDVTRLYTILAAEATAPEHPAHQYFHDRFERLMRELTAVLVEIQEAGLLVEGWEPEDAACSTIAVTEGLQTLWLSDVAGIDMSRGVRAHMQQFVSVPL